MRIKIGGILILFALIWPAALPAQTPAGSYPDKPVKIIVPFAPAGPTDIVARLMATKLSERLGKQFYIDNVTGAGGNTGMGQAARAAPDGYTVLFVSSSYVVNPSLYPKIPYDPYKDFVPVTVAGDAPNILLVHPSVPAKTVAELAELARKRPGEVTYASNGMGTTQHLAAEMFATAKGLKLNHIPFNGSAPAVTAMLGGQTMLLFGVASDVMPHIKAGKLRALAVASAKRMQVLPDVPTTAEAGVPGVEIEIWLAAFAPRGTPRELLSRLNSEINKVLEMPDVRERITQDGIGDVKGGTPEELASLLRSEIAKWARVVKASGARVD